VVIIRVVKTPLEQALNLLSACYGHYPDLIMDCLEDQANDKLKIISSTKYTRNIEPLLRNMLKTKYRKNKRI